MNSPLDPVSTRRQPTHDDRDDPVSAAGPRAPARGGAADPTPSGAAPAVRHSAGSRSLVQQFSRPASGAAGGPRTGAGDVPVETRARARGADVAPPPPIPSDPVVATARAAAARFAAELPDHGVDLDALAAEVARTQPKGTAPAQTELRATQAFVRAALAQDPALADRALAARMRGLPAGDRATVSRALASDARTGIYRYAEGERILARLQAAAPSDRERVRASVLAGARFDAALAAVADAARAESAGADPQRGVSYEINSTEAYGSCPDEAGGPAAVAARGEIAGGELAFDAVAPAAAGEADSEFEVALVDWRLAGGVKTSGVPGDEPLVEATGRLRLGEVSGGLGAHGGHLEVAAGRAERELAVGDVRVAFESEVLTAGVAATIGETPEAEIHGELGAHAAVWEAGVELGGDDNNVRASVGAGVGFAVSGRVQDRDGDGIPAVCADLVVGAPVDFGIGYCAENTPTEGSLQPPSPEHGASGTGNATPASADAAARP